MKTELALCYYPTSVVFIDDSVSFLSAMELAFSPRFQCLTFSDPIRALNHANNLKNLDWNAHSKEDYNYYSDSEQFVQNTLNASEKHLSNSNRYNEISVVVIDYDMPEMDGLTFCKNLKNPNIKKILLTGQVTTEEAIRAFNDNVIDYYISKSDGDLVNHLVKAIQDLQNRYFIDISSYIKIRAIEQKKSLFNDASLSDYFSKIIKENKVKEYYFSTNPPRYRLKTEENKIYTLLVYSRYDLNEQIRIIKEEAGPAWLLEGLKSASCVPYFRSKDGFYDQESFDPENTLYPADIVKGRETYFCALIKEDVQPLDPRLLDPSSVFH